MTGQLDREAHEHRTAVSTLAAAAPAGGAAAGARGGTGGRTIDGRGIARDLRDGRASASCAVAPTTATATITKARILERNSAM